MGLSLPFSRVQYNDFTNTDSFYIATGLALQIIRFLTKCMCVCLSSTYGERQKMTAVECML